MYTQFGKLKCAKTTEFIKKPTNLVLSMYNANTISNYTLFKREKKASIHLFREKTFFKKNS